MLQGIDVNKRIEFTSTHDTTDPKTVFVFQPLSGASMFSIAKFAKNDILEISGDDVLGFLEKSIVEIKNFGNASLSVKEVLQILPSNVLAELFKKMAEINNLTEQDKKN